MCSGSGAVSSSRLIDSCITQLKAQRLSRTCDDSQEEEEERSRFRPEIEGRSEADEAVGVPRARVGNTQDFVLSA